VREEALLRLGKRELAQKLDLVLEPDAELVVSATPGLGHQRERVGVVAPSAFSMKFACFARSGRRRRDTP
jgi:hypothetical protein